MKTAEETLTETGVTGNFRFIDGNGIEHKRDDVTYAIEAYADQFKPKWISVKDRLPENNVCVLVWGKEHGGKIVVRDDNVWRKDNERAINYDPSHWMELPQPPQI